MNKKILFAIIASGSLIIILLLVWFLKISQKSKNISINTIDGEQIEVQDFTKTSTRNDEAALTLEDDSNSAVIMYNENSQIFTILVHAREEEEFNRKRVLAEKQFLSELAIDEEQACRLNVEVSIDGPINDLQPFSQPQPLSFCN
jgi:hypothetical protein